MALNVLQQWEKAHWKKVSHELKQAGISLTRDHIGQIIHEMSFKVRSKKHPNSCPLYQEKPPTPCHPEIKELNCLLCDCPQYDSSTEEGACRIKSKKGKFHYHPNLPAGRIWDCSDCGNYHNQLVVKRYLERHFDEIVGKIRTSETF